MASRPLSLHDVADQLGVHYMTAYRYVRLGQLEATKHGAHWQVEPVALARFLRRHRPAGERVPSAASGGPAEQWGVDWSARYEVRLLAGDHAGSFAVLEAALVAGAELEDIYLDVVTPALQRVGSRWAAGEIDVADEHLASGIVRQHLGRLSSRVGRRGRSRGTVLIGCAPGERHDLGPAVVVALARLAGFDGVDLGADVPAASFGVAAARAERLVAVGISVSSPLGAQGFGRAVAEVRRAAPGVPLLAGGPWLSSGSPELAGGADHVAVDAGAAVRVLEELAPRRQRRPGSPSRRGRSSPPVEPVLEEVGGSRPVTAAHAAHVSAQAVAP